MITTPLSGPTPQVAHRSEWWEQMLSSRRRRGAHHHEPAQPATPAVGGDLVRTAVSWAAVLWVAGVCLLDDTLRPAVMAYGKAVLLLVLWFALTRTRTISWRLTVGVFGVGAVWAAAVARTGAWLGPHVAESALLALPFVALPAAVPGRVRRFAVTDWLLVGCALGLSYQAVGTALAQAGRVLRPPVPAGEHPFYLVLAFAGLVCGLSVAAWRHGRRGQGREAAAWQLAAVIGPVLAGLLVLGADRPTGTTGTGLLLRPFAGLAGHDVVLLVLLVLLFGAALLIDTRRLRAVDEPGVDRLPFPYAPAAAADRWTLAVTGPGNPGRPSPFFHVATAATWATCCLITYAVRDVAVVVGAHVRVDRESRAAALERGRAASVLTRALRAEAFRPRDARGVGRRVARVLSAAGAIGLVAGGVLAAQPAVAAQPWLGRATQFLDGQAPAPGVGGRIVVWLTLVALLALTCDTPGFAFGADGAPRPLLDRGAGEVVFLHGDTATALVRNDSVPELLLDGAAAVLTLVPGSVARRLVGSAAGARAHAVVDGFRSAPATFLLRRRRELDGAGSGDEPGERSGSWDDAARRRWVDARLASDALRIVSSDGRTGVPLEGLFVAGDGVVAVEATHVHPADAGRLYEGLVPVALAERLLAPFDDEMRRYATVVRDPRNPVARLRLVVGSERAGQVLGDRARQILGSDLDLVVVLDPTGV